MNWSVKHKSGRILFVTDSKVTADNRRKMGWVVEEVKMTSREQFEKWIKEETGFDLWRTEYPMTEWDDQQYKCHQTNLAWMAWQSSRAAIGIDENPACWATFYPDTDEESGREHSQSNERCARRIASEIGGYVVPIYYGNPENVEVKK